MHDKPRILLLLQGLHLTGAPRVILDAFTHLRDGVELWTLARAFGPFAPQFEALGKLNIVTDDIVANNAVTRRLKLMRRHLLERAVANWKPDLIYANSVASVHLARTFALPDAPMVVHVHELASYFGPYADSHGDVLLQKPAHFIACSQAVATMMTGRFAVDPARITVRHEFVAARRFENLARPPRKDDRIVVGGCGAISLRKGPELFLQLAAHLLRIAPGKFRFAWVGIGTDEASQQFAVAARAMGLGPDVLDLVPVTPDPLPAMSAFDVFAMTSYEDPCPIVVLEAMMLGTPVACFGPSGGAPEEVGDTGLVVADFSPADMADAIARRWTDPARRTADGTAAAARARALFTDAVAVPAISDVIQRFRRR